VFWLSCKHGNVQKVGLIGWVFLEAS
jgi:hypothetical protein